MYLYTTTQDQYAFIHDAVLEWLICGDTKIPAGEMKRAMERLSQKEAQTGQSGYDTQFKVDIAYPYMANAIHTWYRS